VLIRERAVADGPALPSAAPPARPRAARPTAGRLRWSLAAAVFGLSFWYRFQTLEFANDHFLTILQGRQILVYGELPVRDFADPGFFLMAFASAVAQAIFGHSLLGEALWSLLLLSAGASLTFLLASHISRSAAIALGLTFLVVVMAPRLYHYPKVFLPVFGLSLIWRYADRASLANLAFVAAGTAFAFLLRHDHGAYVAVAAGVTLLARHWRDGLRLLVRRLGFYGIVTTVLLAPFFAYLEAGGGAVDYFRSALEFARSEAKRQPLFQFPPFVVEPASPAPPPPRVALQWRPGVTDEVRASLERQYKLAAPTPLGDRSWQYEVLDASQANLRALVDDRQVEDTDKIDRAAGRLSEPGEPLVVSLRRTWAGFGVFAEPNAVAWLYYLFVGLPFVATLVLVRKRSRPDSAGTGVPFETPKILSVAALCAVSAGLLLREPLNARLPDVAAPIAVLAAWLLGQWLGLPLVTGVWLQRARDLVRPGVLTAPRPPRRGRLRALRWGAAFVFAAITWSSVATVSRFERQLEVGQMDNGVRAARSHAAKLLADLRASPPAEKLAPVPRNLPLADYVRACTRPSDRLLVTHFMPDIHYYAGRAFAGDQFVFYHQYRTSPEDQQRFLDRLRAQSVPVVIARMREYEGEFDTQFNLLHDYLTAHYRLAGAVHLEGEDFEYRVLVDPRAAPSETYAPLSLPCYG
jgi:hypothetical protein